jgi:hypothetical protein
MPHLPIRRIVLLAALPALLSACSDLPSEPALVDQFSRLAGGKGRQAELAGHIRGGLMSSQRELEGILGRQLDFAFTYADQPEDGWALVVGPLSQVTFDFEEWSQERYRIRFRAEAEAELWFRCWPSTAAEPRLAYARQPLVFSGTMQPDRHMPAIRSAKDFRDWLLSNVYVVFTHYIMLEYDDSCTPTQVFPGGS